MTQSQATRATSAAGTAESTLAVSHITTYRYDRPLSQGRHTFRLRPVDDRRQRVLEHALTVSVAGELFEFEDVFGNYTHYLEVTGPFTELGIESHSVVRIAADGGLRAGRLPQDVKLPLMWMPWQHQMMLPYLLPPELPEPELKELSDYAAGFVSRNGADLFRTLEDMNTTLHREYEYVPGSTHVETTPYDVYRQRRGVCQDFANLLICLARLQSIPARYRVGYIYTAAPQVQSQASHAWVEVYLPWLGWRGLDPTNGTVVAADHVRVAAGRNYLDATPTTGIVAPGGVHETLEVEVRVERRDGPADAR